MELPKTATLREAIAMIRTALGVLEEIPEEDVRLCKWSSYEGTSFPVEMVPDTLIPKCELTYSCDLVLETREPGTDWPVKIEIGSGIAGTAYERSYVTKIAKFDSATDQLDPSGWTDVVLKMGTTVGDLRALAERLYGIEPEQAIIVKLTTHQGVEEFKGADETCLRDTSARVYSNGTQIVVRDRRLEGDGSKVPALKDAVAGDDDEAQVFFTEVDGSTRSGQHASQNIELNARALIEAHPKMDSE
jgi:hypothetical protein